MRLLLQTYFLPALFLCLIDLNLAGIFLTTAGFPAAIGFLVPFAANKAPQPGFQTWPIVATDSLSFPLGFLTGILSSLPFPVNNSFFCFSAHENFRKHKHKDN